jgi:hypothetical protein
MRYCSFFSTFIALLCFSACSIPSLESQDCSTARDAVKQFYSFHFGNDMHPSAENLKARERFLTKDLYAQLSQDTSGATDYFTASTEPPKTFKIAKCVEKGPGDVDMQVQVYWRDDAKTQQKEVHVETVKTGDAWLINKVSN